jgi:hypothetical protein
MASQAFAANALSAAALLSVCGVADASAQNAVQTSVYGTRAFVRDTCPVLQERFAINPTYEGSREMVSALGLGAQFLTSLADTSWGMVANAFERAGRDAVVNIDAGAGFDFYQTYVAGDALAFTKRGSELVIDGPPLVVGETEAPPTRRSRCLVFVSGLFGYSAEPINLGVDLNGHWQSNIIRGDAGETLQGLGLAAAPDVYVEALIMEDEALGAMSVHPILVRYSNSLPGLRGNRPLDATMSIVFSKTPTLARSTERDPEDVFAALLIEFGAIRPGTVLGPLELSGAGVDGLPMRPTDDEALYFVRADFAVVSQTGANGEGAPAQRLALHNQGVGVAPTWIEAAFVVTRSGNPLMRAIGEAMKGNRDEAQAFFRNELVGGASAHENRVSIREGAQRDYELAMIDVEMARLEVDEAEAGSAAALSTRRTLIEKQYRAREAARAAGLPEPNWP